MARRGWSTVNFLRYAGAVVTAYPFTMACWGKTSITATAQTLMGLFASGSTQNANGIARLIIDTANKVEAVQSATAVALSSTTISANTWFHACGVYNSATDRRAFLNGAGKGTNATSLALTAPNRTSIGVGDGSSAANPFAPAGTGDIAEACIWNIALSDADVLALSNGIHPFLVHPEAMVGYWPLIGAYSPEINLLSNTSVLTMQGTVTASPHTRVFNPSIGRARLYGSSSTANMLTAALGTFAYSGVAVGIVKGYRLPLTAGAYTYTGVAAGIIKGYRLAAVAGAYALSGAAAGFKLAWHLVATAGAYVYSGVAAGIKRGFTLAAVAGAYTYTGVAAGFKLSWHLIATAGAYTYTGVAATFTRGLHLIATAGAYVISGVAVNFPKALHLLASTGTYILTGVAAVLTVAPAWAAAVVSYINARNVAASLQKSRQIAPALQVSHTPPFLARARQNTPSLYLARSAAFVLQKLRGPRSLGD